VVSVGESERGREGGMEGREGERRRETEGESQSCTP